MLLSPHCAFTLSGQAHTHIQADSQTQLFVSYSAQSSDRAWAVPGGRASNRRGSGFRPLLSIVSDASSVVCLSLCLSAGPAARVAKNQLHTSAQKRRDKNESFTHTHRHTLGQSTELHTHTLALAMFASMCVHACIIQGRRHLADDCRQFVCSAQHRAVAFAVSASVAASAVAGAAWCCWAARPVKTTTGLVWRRRRWLWGPPSV